MPTWPSGSLALEFSFLRGKGGAHVLPQMRLWKEREAGLEQAEEDKRDFSAVMSAERATQTLKPKMASGIFQDSRFHQVWSGPVCLRTSSRADLRQLPGGSHPQIIKIRPLGPAVAGMCICNQLFRCLPCDTERWGLLSGNIWGWSLSWPPPPKSALILASTLLPSIQTGLRKQETFDQPISIHACSLRGGPKALKMLLL